MSLDVLTFSSILLTLSPMNGVRKPKCVLIQLWHWQACFSYFYRLVFRLCAVNVTILCMHACLFLRTSLSSMSQCDQHHWGSSQPVSFIIPSNYSKSSFQSSCSTRSSLSPSSPPSSHVSIHHTYALFISFILPFECTKVSPTAPSSPYLHEIGACDEEN